MRKQLTLLIVILLAVTLVVVLSIRGWHSANETVDLSPEEEQAEQTHTHDHEVADSNESHLDDKAMEAANAVRNAQSAADVMKGVQLLRANLAEDSNHIPSIELLAELSIQSGQLDKAYQRYEKLVSLQPENQEYKARLAHLCEQLGRSDC